MHVVFGTTAACLPACLAGASALATQHAAAGVTVAPPDLRQSQNEFLIEHKRVQGKSWAAIAAAYEEKFGERKTTEQVRCQRGPALIGHEVPDLEDFERESMVC